MTLQMTLVCLPVLFGLWTWRRFSKVIYVSAGHAALFFGFATLLGAGVYWSTEHLRVFFELDPHDSSRSSSLFWFTLFLDAPLVEAAKALVLWRAYRRGRLTSGRVGALFAVLAGAGFAAGEAVMALVEVGRFVELAALRTALAFPAQVFFAGAWGYFLGGARRDRFFAGAWVASVVVHAVYRSIIFFSAPAYFVVALPLLLCMVGFIAWLLRQPALALERKAALLESLGDPGLRNVWARRGRPLKLHWIVVGALVTLGVMLAFLVLAVYWGHRLGIDFSLVEEPGVRGALPVAVLGTALLLSFPVAAFLVARASGAESVVEPAWSSGMAVLLVLGIFSASEPSALVIALGIAPVGFFLACIGAWFGLDRS